MRIKTKTNGKARTFDWESARQRIAASMTVLHSESQVAPEVLERIWAQRAAQLAKMPVQEVDGERREFVLVRLGREVFGLDVQHVIDIRPARQITRVPRVPAWMIGVANLRGRLLSVIDPVHFFELPPNKEDAEKEAYLVVIKAGEMEMALRVVEVLGVESLYTGLGGEAAETIHGLPPEYIQGVVRRDKSSTHNGSALCVILDLAALMADNRLIVRGEIL